MRVRVCSVGGRCYFLHHSDGRVGLIVSGRYVTEEYKSNFYLRYVYFPSLKHTSIFLSVNSKILIAAYSDSR